ncbi:MAG: UDP-glucose 4-epimerase GalE [Bacteroidota bacterium]|jgi:UDP-glucose 4-epimerase|nr:UDP-glucose 4-epimerase GalE [Bacteroidia bacterium]MBP6009464.1 UDP-glucose 4-epimerase GalE [Bacteroidia bacterium]MBP7268717.1 UDP-glucose 4-epimerase GalE [Bacteroidia bacterium]MBP7771549.1 UDP-glucose 4-epimerase GalE [Bacteroidia bacterium]HPD54605.1 UDP-glucose 4-epimerase GalE [Bacteroidia bacterium]
MNILVTGGTGYIGSHTAVELIQRGYNAILLDNLSNSREEVVHAIGEITGKKIDFFNIDLCDKKELDKFFSVYKIDAVIHFAAFKAVGESVEDPLRYYRNNLESLINLLEIYRDRGLDNFLFSSSCSVYGQASKLPVSEDAPLLKAESPYGNTKQIGEEILADTIRVSKFRGIALRYFNPAGAHPSALIGEYPLQAPNNLVPVITQTAIGKRPGMTVFGSDYDTPDGTCVRDYIHVVDIARAHIAAMERLIQRKNKTPFEIFNLGTGTGFTVLQTIQAFEKVTGKPLNYTLGPRRPGDVEKVWADTTLVSKELGWKAELGIEEIMRSAWAWELRLQEESKKQLA